MSFALECQKVKRTGFTPAFIGGGIIAAAVPALNMAFRSEMYIHMDAAPVQILLNANWQMMAMLNVLLIVVGACILYNIEYADISIDMLTTPEFNGADILVSSEDIEEQVVLRMMVDKLRSCLLMLSEEERELLHDLFYIGLSERDAAEKYAVSQVAIHKRKKRVLDKLKKMMDC
jgi:RNA polymerase sigma factor (sigma-70 family)